MGLEEYSHKALDRKAFPEATARSASFSRVAGVEAPERGKEEHLMDAQLFSLTHSPPLKHFTHDLHPSSYLRNRLFPFSSWLYTEGFHSHQRAPESASPRLYVPGSLIALRSLGFKAREEGLSQRCWQLPGGLGPKLGLQVIRLPW